MIGVGSDGALKESLAEIARRLWTRGWVANHDGNVTARLASRGGAAGRYLATPTATSKRVIAAAGLIVVDDQGKTVQGAGKPFGEIGLHLTVFQNRPDVNAVIHAHPPGATGIACSGARIRATLPGRGRGLAGRVDPERCHSRPPGAPACAALAPFVLGHDAVLLGNHGVLAWGADLEQAYLRLELVEHLASIALAAERAGGVTALPDSALSALLEARKKAGLGLAASGEGSSSSASGKKPVVACAPAPGSDVEIIAPGRSRATVLASPAPDMATIIREELVKALRKG